MKLDNLTEIINVKIINIDTGQEKELFERLDSRCHFNDVIILGKFFIQLRLDWGDIQSGEPMLDADIWTERKGRNQFLKKERWHHTEKKFDPETQQNIYEFKFKNLILRLQTRKTIGKNVSLDAILE